MATLNKILIEISANGLYIQIICKLNRTQDNNIVRNMLSINEATKKLGDMIQTRMSSMSMDTVLPFQTPEQMIGQVLLDKFALQLVDATSFVQQNESYMEELLENLLMVLAMAGIMGVDLENKLTKLLEVMESIYGEAS